MSDFSPRTTPNFLSGLFLACHAITDSLLVIRGAGCVEEMVRQTLGSHALGNPLTPAGEGGWMVHTSDHLSSALGGTERGVDGVIREALKHRKVGVVILGQLGFFDLMGQRTQFLAETLSRAFSIPFLTTDQPSMARDSFDAFRLVLDEMARHIVQSPCPDREPGTVSIVGHLYPRNEGDGQGDVLELQRLIRGAGGIPSTILLSAIPWNDCLRASRADVLVATPPGRPTARTLAAHTGASVLDLPLPVSLEGTSQWVRALSNHLGQSQRGEEFIRKEIGRIVPALRQVVLPHLVGKRVALFAEPDWLPGIHRCLEEDLGMHVLCSVQRCRHPQGDADGEDRSEVPERLFDPSVDSIRYHLGRAMGGGIDVIIASRFEWNVLSPSLRQIPFLEFGYPQYRTHFLRPTPHLGFEGVLTLAERVLSALLVRA